MGWASWLLSLLSLCCLVLSLENISTAQNIMRDSVRAPGPHHLALSDLSIVPYFLQICNSQGLAGSRPLSNGAPRGGFNKEPLFQGVGRVKGTSRERYRVGLASAGS